MKHRLYVIVKASLLMLAVICFQSFSGKSGGDYYKVLLNGRLVAEQYLTKPVALKVLSLSAANQNDKLAVYYSHCGQMGRSRSISLKNEDGKILKEWKFNDSQSQQMQLSVSEILNASAKQGSVMIYYASKEIPAGKQLITLNLSSIASARR
jgi:hypothetical protein